MVSEALDQGDVEPNVEQLEDADVLDKNHLKVDFDV